MLSTPSVLQGDIRTEKGIKIRIRSSRDLVKSKCNDINTELRMTEGRSK